MTAKVKYVVNQEHDINTEGVLAKWIVEQPHLKEEIFKQAEDSGLNLDKIKLYLLFS